MISGNEQAGFPSRCQRIPRFYPWREGPALEAHDDDEPHFHEISEEEKGALAEFIWNTDNVELTTVGIDIGSSTSHLMFARVHLQRKAQMLSSRFVVVDRKILWKSSILLTPFLPDNTIDAASLKSFIDEAYRTAGLARDDIDSGAVILTGEAIKRKNAEAIARLFAAESGKFVCASAGHHLESMLAAHGSGAVALSRKTHRTVLNVDVGGGTTKFALIQNGVICGTCAIAVGGRLLVQAGDGRWIRIDDSAHQAAATLGMRLRFGDQPAPGDVDRIVDALADVVIAFIEAQPPAGLAKALLLTAPLTFNAPPHLVTFSGGVSEYIFGRETATYGDIAKPLAEKIAQAFAGGRAKTPFVDPGQGIRATVIGASQFSVQVSGKTIHVSQNTALPLYNVPVLFPALAFNNDFSAAAVTTEVRSALTRADIDRAQPVALAIRWHGDPHYARLRGLAEGLAGALDAASPSPLILMVDGDVGKLLGHILEQELKIARPVVSIDCIQLNEFDYVDIGEVVEPAHVMPIVIKSLLFSGGR